MGQGKLSYPLPSALLYPAALVSGATALLYEIVWARRLSLLLGSTTSAAAAVLSSFMLGLALGAIVVGWRADESRRPLRWYGMLELGIGIYALAFDSLLDLAGGPLGSRPWLLSFLILLLPAALMGGTLPVLARSGADTTERGTRAFGGLYGMNTLGAVLGALATTLWLMESLGLSGATTLAAGVNIALGVGFWLLGMRVHHRDVFADEPVRTGGRWTGDAEPLVLGIFFIAGFSGLALEIAWTRLLVYLLEGFTIAFGLMLAAYLLGLGAGALAGTGMAVRSTNPRRLLARILLFQGVLAIATYLLAGPLCDSLEAARAEYVEATGMDRRYAWSLFFTAAVIVLPSTFCAGMLMPVVARIALSDREAIGRHTGVVYAVTTLGAVIAPPIAAFVLVPALGVPGTIALLAALVVLSGTSLAFSRGLREWVFAGSAAVAFVAVCLGADLGEPAVRQSHVFRAAKAPRRLVDFEEGLLGGVSVVEELKDGTRRLYIDGFSAAETSPHYGYMRMLGHLPVLLHPAPKRVCVIAFGTGTTAGAVAVHDAVERLVCVEIEPAVYDVAGHFAETNRDVLEMDKSEQVVADGRAFLRRGGERFDVITLEPLMPYTPAAVYLYTREFYEEARASLAAGGLLCQWIPPQGVANADLKRLVASMAEVFPHVSLWYFKHAVVVVGGEAAPRIDAASLTERCATAEVLEDFQTAVVGDPAHLLGAHVCSGEALRRALEGADPFVDDHTDLEFRPLPRGLGKLSTTYFAQNLEFLARQHQAEVPWLAEAYPGAAEAIASQGVLLDSLAQELRHRVDGLEPVDARPLFDRLEEDPGALFLESVAHRREYRVRVLQGRYGEAGALSLAPDRSVAYLALAERTDGEERRYYLTLAVGENALLTSEHPDKAADLLRELAEGQADDVRRYLLNRARALEEAPLEPGPERRPTIDLPDLRAALDAGDVESARSILDQAHHAGLFAQVDRDAREWFREQEDARAALEVLDRIGSGYTLIAAHQVARRKTTEDLAAVAPIYATRSVRKWEELCRDLDPAVREIAADAAKGVATRAHLPALAKLCGDAEERVRLSAILAFRDVVPDAEKQTGYDYRAPTEESLEKLRALVRGS